MDRVGPGPDQQVNESDEVTQVALACIVSARRGSLLAFDLPDRLLRVFHINIAFLVLVLHRCILLAGEGVLKVVGRFCVVLNLGKSLQQQGVALVVAACFLEVRIISLRRVLEVSDQVQLDEGVHHL